LRIPLLLLSVGGKMNKQEVLKALQELREQPKRKFSQSVELIINLKNINIKSNPLDFFITLPSPRGKGIKIAAFAGAELEKQAKENCDLVIMQTDFANYDKKQIKKLAQEYDYFVASNTDAKGCGIIWTLFRSKRKNAKSKDRVCSSSKCKLRSIN